ncbi:MAG: outer rane hemin/siderophore receptor protein [Burkholderiaceae bacterium]|nr:outer rane hemin/siderophore receptor protein [Burkholderiaceae bacterium]
MIFSVSCSRAPAFAPLALVAALSTVFNSSVFAQDEADKALTPVVVTASRFANDPALAPIGAAVISAGEIRGAGIDNVNEAVRKLGGVYGRQSSYGTQDYELDLRGFGTNSSQNMVVLVDGIRLSENELTAPLLSSIPIDTVERIEIIRGGSSVLYGDGATGGVIHIITKRGTTTGTRGSASLEIGSFNHREARASVMTGWEGVALDASASKMKSDNYRDNNAVTLENFSGGAQWTSKEGRAGVRVDVSRQDSRLPGALTLAQFNANPRQANTPNDYASLDTNRFTAFVERRLGEWDAAAELSHRERKASAFYDMGSYGTSMVKYDTKQTQFSPRLRKLSTSGGVTNEFVAGLDFTHWNRVTDSASSKADATQNSRAVYLRDEVKWGNARIAAGVRHENFDKDSVDPVPYTKATYSKKQSLNAWELQGSYALAPQATVFAKAGRSYRVANVDENALTALANEPLKPQTSNDLELGATFGDKAKKLTVRLFQHRLHDEIFYDPTVGYYGANVNLDPTRRRGIEIEGSLRLAPAWMVNANLQHVQATFTDGPYAGREMVMVPKNTASARLSWLPGSGQSASVGAQWASEQRYGGDFSNTCSARIPSHLTFDARYAQKIGQWEFALVGANLTNRHYFSNAYGCASGIYPDAGRQLKVTARYDF